MIENSLNINKAKSLIQYFLLIAISENCCQNFQLLTSYEVENNYFKKPIRQMILIYVFEEEIMRKNSFAKKFTREILKL